MTPPQALLPAEVDTAETDALLGKEQGATPDDCPDDGPRQRKGVPQGRAVAEAILELMAENEHITKVPGIRPGTQEGSAEWVRVEKYHGTRSHQCSARLCVGRRDIISYRSIYVEKPISVH